MQVFNSQSCNRSVNPHLRLWHLRGGIGPVVTALLVASALAAPVGAQQALPSTLSPQMRAALLSMFDQEGMGLGQQQGQAIRSRANRRGPDVGYVSSDPICLECVLQLLAPPAASPPWQPPAPTVAEVIPPPFPPVVSFIPMVPGLAQSSWGGLPSPEQPSFLPPPISPPLEPESPMVRTSLEVLPPAIPLQTPGPLPILGAAAALRISRQLRRRINTAGLTSARAPLGESR